MLQELLKAIIYLFESLHILFLLSCRCCTLLPVRTLRKVQKFGQRLSVKRKCQFCQTQGHVCSPAKLYVEWPSHEMNELLSAWQVHSEIILADQIPDRFSAIAFKAESLLLSLIVEESFEL
jgi:hypothetical protein